MKILQAVPAADYCITIYFDNRHSVTLDMKSKLETVRFSGLRDEQMFRAVRTDGKAVHWPHGISLAVSEIIELVAK